MFNGLEPSFLLKGQGQSVDTFVSSVSRSYKSFSIAQFISYFTQSAFGVRVCSDYKQILYAADISEIQFRP